MVATPIKAPTFATTYADLRRQQGRRTFLAGIALEAEVGEGRGGPTGCYNGIP